MWQEATVLVYMEINNSVHDNVIRIFITLGTWQINPFGPKWQKTETNKD